ncbi:MAG: hypothetical protein AAGA56_22275 [Myxococcota bacterium]
MVSAAWRVEMVKRLVGPLLGLFACSPSAAPLDPAAVEGQPPLNPTLDDGRLVYRSFGDHHPTCFAFLPESRDTEDVPCPPGAIEQLARCPAGKLIAKKIGTGCGCVPEDDSAPTSIPCPAE